MQTKTPDTRTNEDILSQYGDTEFPDTPAACTALFKQIAQDGLIPYAAYGMPDQVSFASLLSLFSLNCVGNGEFDLQNQYLTYDKISDSAQSYLRFLRELYQKDYFPSDFLSMDAIGAIDLLINGKSPLCTVSSPQEAALIDTLSQKHEISIVFEPVHSQSGYAHIPSVRKRNLIAVSQHARDFDRILKFCSYLLENPAAQQLFLSQPSSQEQKFIDQYSIPLSSVQLDAVSQKPIYLRLMKIHDQLDREVIQPYYAKICTGDLPLEAFQEMQHKWAESGGDNLLEMLTRYIIS